MPLAVFPEGATFRGDEVRPFKAGAFAAVRGLEVPVIPVGFAYEPGAEYVDMPFGQHALNLMSRPRTRVVMVVGGPILATGRADALAETARSEVQRLVDRARSHADCLRMKRFGLDAAGGSPIE